VNVLLELREMFYGKEGWATEGTQTMLEVRTVGWGKGSEGDVWSDGLLESWHEIITDASCCCRWKLMLERSALANDLKQVYHGLRAGETLSVVVNGWVHLSMRVHPVC